MRHCFPKVQPFIIKITNYNLEEKHTKNQKIRTHEKRKGHWSLMSEISTITNFFFSLSLHLLIETMLKTNETVVIEMENWCISFVMVNRLVCDYRPERERERINRVNNKSTKYKNQHRHGSRNGDLEQKKNTEEFFSDYLFCRSQTSGAANDDYYEHIFFGKFIPFGGVYH